MGKMKIEIKKPQYLDAREPAAEILRAPRIREKKPSSPSAFFGLLMLATYILSGLAIWCVFQKFSARF